MGSKVSRIIIDGRHRLVNQVEVERTPKGILKTEKIHSKDLGNFIKQTAFTPKGKKVATTIKHLDKDKFEKEAVTPDTATLMNKIFWSCDEA